MSKQRNRVGSKPQHGNQRARFNSMPRTLESLEKRMLLTASPTFNSFLSSSWHNVSRPSDVNHDGLVSPLDALTVVNRLSAAGGIYVASSTANFGSVNHSSDS